MVGLKPTYGRVSRRGLVAYASSLDVVAPIAASVKDAALALESMCVSDPLDETECSPSPVQAVEAVSKDIEGLRVGILVEGLWIIRRHKGPKNRCNNYQQKQHNNS